MPRTKRDPDAWPRYVAPALMMTDGRILSVRPVKLTSYDDREAEKKIPLHGDVLKRARGRYQGKDIAAIGYVVNGEWMDAPGRGKVTARGQMFARDARKSSGGTGVVEHEDPFARKLEAGGFDPTKLRRGVANATNRPRDGNGGGDVAVSAHTRDGHEVRAYTRSKPS